jgi:cysteine desulfurase
MLLRLSMKGIMASTGSACSSNSLEPSHVLTAIGLNAGTSHSSMRMTLSRHTTLEEIDYTVSILKTEVDALRKMSPFWNKKNK